MGRSSHARCRDIQPEGLLQRCAERFYRDAARLSWFMDWALTISLSLSVVNVYIQSRSNDYHAKENGLKLVNSVVCFIAFYGLISLNPAEIYKSLRYKPDKPEKRKKKRIRVLNYEPFPKYTESSGKSSAKSEGN
ncbi:Oidioi.mRNA.OKI2018_I69.XSR.g16963.t1.cds [Oikopleura dioica]|uniref:Oidioi.mRNA.OKI2018_I69.XSR.g16963.t1.cds n=1 Tax=Oikopleura dioica TaxID=34765 RepID=A0ABN7SMW9_OIKDI|nr:Oidioi.mRNA.OKI2018_I69.XSR.g16963.t1.cds [Oikopleura dioica]